MTLEQLQPLLDALLVLGICSSRMLGFCSLSAFFSSQQLTGIARRALVLAFTLVIVPPFFESGMVVLHNDQGMFFLLLIKEVLLGAILGWITNFFFYVAQGIGFIIDTQRGASMASLFDPISNSQTSPLGDFLMKFVMVFAILSGGFLLILKGLYASYEALPIFSFLPPLGSWWNSFFIHTMGDNFFSQLFLLGGPVLFLLFLSEFGLGLVTRFAPQLNVFFLSMPIKSELAMFFFLLYLSYLTRYFCTHLANDTSVFTLLKSLHG